MTHQSVRDYQFVAPGMGILSVPCGRGLLFVAHGHLRVASVPTLCEYGVGILVSWSVHVTNNFYEELVLIYFLYILPM